MQSMSVQVAQLSGSASQIRAGAQGIRAELDRLESEVGKLRGAWSGEAQASYDTAQRKWTQSLAEMQGILERISNSADQIAQNYAMSDARNAGRFGA